MIKTLFPGAAFLLLAGAASAQTAPAPTSGHEHRAARPTIESPIEALINDPATKAVMDKHLPGLAEHSAYDRFKGMTLRQVAPFSDGHVTDAVIAAIDTDLKALPAS